MREKARALEPAREVEPAQSSWMRETARAVEPAHKVEPAKSRAMREKACAVELARKVELAESSQMQEKPRAVESAYKVKPACIESPSILYGRLGIGAYPTWVRSQGKGPTGRDLPSKDRGSCDKWCTEVTCVAF